MFEDSSGGFQELKVLVGAVWYDRFVLLLCRDRLWLQSSGWLGAVGGCVLVGML
jgi:hypothetical protein